MSDRPIPQVRAGDLDPLFQMGDPTERDPHNWTEDFPHENGRYVHRCPTCREKFIGHKRRVSCRQCAPPSTATPLSDARLKEIRGIHEAIQTASLADLLREVDRLRAQVASVPGGEVTDEIPKCNICGKVAACLGRYEGADEWTWACNDCCGHACEDGACYHLADIANLANYQCHELAEAEKAIETTGLPAALAKANSENGRLREILEDATEAVIDYANVSTPNAAGDPVPLEPTLGQSIRAMRLGSAHLLRDLRTRLAAAERERDDQRAMNDALKHALSDMGATFDRAEKERDAALARLAAAEAIARAAVEWTDASSRYDRANGQFQVEPEFSAALDARCLAEGRLDDAIATHRSALTAPVAAPEMKALILPADRYLKSRAVGDWTYSSHSEGYSAALSDVADRLKAAGIPFIQEPDPVGETPEP